MASQIDTATVSLWGMEIGAVTWDPQADVGVFEYMPDFLESGIQVSPYVMPLLPRTFTFPELSRNTFKGLPGLLADSLPDKFGSALIDQWLAREGIDKKDFSPVQRLCYIGSRGMGALEFIPSVDRKTPKDEGTLDIAAMVGLADKILTEREELGGAIDLGDDAVTLETLREILQVGVSAAGARAKVVVAWNEATQDVRSGQLTLPAGFQHWLLKFDGVSNNRDKELADGKGYGLMEYAYYRMASDAGIEMNECRILEENGRHHFMTKRFDRTASGEKLHMQSLGALAHYDFNMAGAYSYEQAIQMVERLELGMASVEQLYRRALFNIMARNQDDHVKNIAFLMDSSGIWQLSPAFDLTFAYNPDGEFTSKHQMSLNGKRDDFTRQDFLETASRFNIPVSRAKKLIEEVAQGVRNWETHAQEAGVPDARIESRQKLHRLY
ncbi:MAG: type II toxin-antitoxin system HipA family toxin [Halioglobus sp.]